MPQFQFFGVAVVAILFKAVVHAVNLKPEIRPTGKWSPVVPRQTVNLDIDKILEKQKENRDIDSFFHTKELLQAIRAGQNSFEVFENVHDVPEKSRLSYEEITSSTSYNATVKYFLKPAKYFSLDSDHVASKIKEITSDTISHCGIVSVGDYFIGSVNGAWMSSANTASWKAHTVSNKGLNFARVVESVSEITSTDQTRCSVLHTKEIPSIRLFNNFRIESKSRFPFSHYESLPQPKSQLHAQSFTGDSPDPPAVLCSDTSIFNDDDYNRNHTGQDDDFTILMGDSGLTNACASINLDFLSLLGESFNFNYNPKTGGASNSFSLGSGLTCDNCYAYIGVYIYVVMEYWDTYASLAFEAKLDGGVGFNVQVGMSNPSVSGSTTVPLLPSSSTSSSLSLGFGLSLSTNFGGLSATISGSGSATGSATMGAGANANAYVGVEYDYNSSYYGFQFPTNAEFTYQPPYLSYSSFDIDSLDVTVELTATQDFTLGYTWGIIYLLGADFTLVFNGQAEYEYAAAAAVSPSSIAVSVDLTGESVNFIPASNEAISSSSLPSARPGDIIPLTVTVNGFNPGEETVLFFSFHRGDYKSDIGVSIFKTRFVVPSDGSGVVSVNWQLPWDSRFLQSPAASMGPCQISVHASNRMAHVVQSQEFVLIADPQSDSLVTTPLAGTTVPANSALTIEWSPAALSYFKKSAGGSGHGSLETVSAVTIALMREEVSSTGEVISSTTFNLTTAFGVPNNGKAQVLIPSEAYPSSSNTDTTQRYFLFVASSKLRNIRGWSNGYFSVSAPAPADGPTAAAASPVALHSSALSAARVKQGSAASVPITSLVHSPALSHNTQHHHSIHYNKLSNMFGVEYMSAEVKRASKISTARELQSSCSGCSDTLTFSANVDGTLTNVYVFEIPFKVGLSTGAVNVLSPVCDCVSGTSDGPVPAPAPAAPPAPAPSPPAYDDFSLAEYVDDNVPSLLNGGSLAPTAYPTTTSGRIGSAAATSALSTAAIGGIVGGIATVILAVAALASYYIARARARLLSSNSDDAKNFANGPVKDVEIPHMATATATVDAGTGASPNSDTDDKHTSGPEVAAVVNPLSLHVHVTKAEALEVAV